MLPPVWEAMLNTSFWTFELLWRNSKLHFQNKGTHIYWDGLINLFCKNKSTLLCNMGTGADWTPTTKWNVQIYEQICKIQVIFWSEWAKNKTLGITSLPYTLPLCLHIPALHVIPYQSPWFELLYKSPLHLYWPIAVIRFVMEEALSIQKFPAATNKNSKNLQIALYWKSNRPFCILENSGCVPLNEVLYITRIVTKTWWMRARV